MAQNQNSEENKTPAGDDEVAKAAQAKAPKAKADRGKKVVVSGVTLYVKG